MRARTGKAFEEKMGAEVNSAKVRKKGQISGDNQVVSCVSEKVITAEKLHHRGRYGLKHAPDVIHQRA